MDAPGDRAQASSRLLTVPNLISALRIAAIPVFWVLIVDDDTTAWGIVLFGVVVATDWVDGTIARRTGQVSELGKVLDPLADRLAIAAGLIALVVRGAFPAWAAGLILARDVAVLAAWAVLATKGFRLDVRWIGKVATFELMIAIPAVSWGTLGLWPAGAALAIGWPVYALGIVEYYIAAAAYAADLRRTLRTA
ncbi:MAG: CDP-alcohol phosphatidyltransferase family protein [Actinomycetota bacterium]|nr:CDP-alcohol phosphatidyltransferase family protein [Actinomycetota bacterium]MDH5313665.1 CDP-alcohol phosphatidyltransferase family protein [Actinomycetota bacterium]